MHLVQRGDARAFEALYDRHGQVAFSLAYRIAGSRTAAEDIVQEAFLSIWRSAVRYERERGNLRSWLLSVVHNRAIDWLRRSVQHDRRRADAGARRDARGPCGGGGMTVRDHQEYVESIGPYVLGALPDDEVDMLELHLETCESCRHEVEQLRPVSAAPARSVPQVEPSPSLKASLMKTVREEAALRAVAEGRRPSDVVLGRSSRLPAWLGALPPRLALAGALAVLAIGVIVGVVAGQSSRGPATRTIAAQINRSLMPQGDASLSVSAGDRRATVRLDGAPRPSSGRVYQLWIQRGKTIERGPVFTVDSRGDGSQAVPGGVRGVDAVMVTVERAPGAAAPTGPPIMRLNV